MAGHFSSRCLLHFFNSFLFLATIFSISTFVVFNLSQITSLENGSPANQTQVGENEAKVGETEIQRPYTVTGWSKQCLQWTSAF